MIDVNSETGDHVYVVEVLPAPLLMSDSCLQVICHHAQVIIHIVHRVRPVMREQVIMRWRTHQTLTCVRRPPSPPRVPGAGTWPSGHPGCQDTRTWRLRQLRTSQQSPLPQRGWTPGPRGCEHCGGPRSRCCKHVCDWAWSLRFHWTFSSPPLYLSCRGRSVICNKISVISCGAQCYLLYSNISS